MLQGKDRWQREALGSDRLGIGVKVVRITVKGRWIIAAVVLVFTSAFGLSHNLMFLFGSFLLAALIYNLLSVVVCMRRLEVTLCEPEYIFAGEPAGIPVQVRNTKRLVTAVDVGIALTCEGVAADVTAAVDRLPPGLMKDVILPIQAAHRGLLNISEIQVFSSHPFGFVRRTRRIETLARVLVYPRLLDEAPPLFDEELTVGGVMPQRTGDYQYLDAYQHGEDVRMIHWRKSTLSELPVVKRDLAHHRAVAARLFIPDACAHFEFALSWLATLAVTQGEGLSWATWSDEGIVLHVDSRELLDALAVMTPTKAMVDAEELRRDGWVPVFASTLTPVALTWARGVNDPIDPHSPNEEARGDANP